MKMVEYFVRDGIGILRINNPPVNSLNHKLFKCLYDCLQTAAADECATALVICGKGGHFSAGSDITEFAKLIEKEEPFVHIHACNALESSEKPVIAAIHGYAHGGGLELALACHYRIATSKATLGLPDVKLGVLPAAGGTQRLPRLVGLDAAMEWTSSGRLYSADTAMQLGMIDEIVPDNEELLQTAISYAKTVASRPLTGRHTSSLPVKDCCNVDLIFGKHARVVNNKYRGQMSPSVNIQAVRFSANSLFSTGVEKERECLTFLATSGQAKALQYCFFGEQQVRQWIVPQTTISWKSAEPESVTAAAVIGLGTMGRGIAINFLKANIPIFVIERDAICLKAGLKSVYDIIDQMATHRVISEKTRSNMKNSVKGTVDYGNLANVDMVIEAAIEEISTKKEIFKKLDKVCKPTAILATNTSALNIDEIASSTRRPSKVMGMHFFAPADRMRLLENIYGKSTSVETIATCMEMGRNMGKVAVLVGNCYGFVANRMYKNYFTESEYLLEEGASPKVIDNALTDYGFAMGRFLVADLSGNDVLYRVRRTSGVTMQQQVPSTPQRERNGKRYCPLPDHLITMNRYGFKTGKGWYDYDDENNPIPSDAVTQMVIKYRQRHGIEPRRIDHQEVIERMLYSLINEGFKVLEEGYAANPVNIDMIWIHGYAWPKHTGGPMFYASTIGLPRLLQVIQHYYAVFGDFVPHWKPSKMLVNLVQQHGNPSIQNWMELSRDGIRTSKSNL